MIEPGAAVEFVPGKGRTVRSNLTGKTIGVADPFLSEWAYIGDVINVMMYPHTIKDLRHDWSHDVVDAVSLEHLDPVDRVLHQMIANGADKAKSEHEPAMEFNPFANDDDDSCPHC